MNRWVVSLDDPESTRSAAVGGKAASVARLRQAGLPVPEGFVLRTETFTVAAAGVSKQVLARVRSRGDDGAGTADLARRLFSRMEMPAGIRQAISSAYDALGKSAPVAVRSSATAEDLPEASFAGQYATCLNAVGVDSIIDCIKAVWASLYSAAALAYRERLGVPHDRVAMAVLVQLQIDARAAGVMFTRDPVADRDGTFVLNVAPGLGEGVAGGGAAADTFRIDRASLQVVGRTVADKPRMLVARRDAGTEWRSVPDARRESPALTDEQLVEAARLGKRVMDLFGDHRDIEFALSADGFHLLQARPVTGQSRAARAFPVTWADPADEQYAWVLTGGDRPLFRLEEDVSDAYARGMRRCFEETGASMTRACVRRRFNGYQYARAPVIDDAVVEERRRRHRARDTRYRERGTSLYLAEVEPEAAAAFRQLNRFRALRGASLRELKAYLDLALDAYARVMGDLHWRMAGATRPDWPAEYHRLTGEPEVDSGVLLQGIDNRTMQLVRRLRGLARLARSDAQLGAAVQARDLDRVLGAGLRNRPAAARFVARFRRLLRDHGRRSGRGYGSSVDFTAPTWNMSPDAPLDLIARYAEQDIAALERQERAARRERQRTAARVRRKLAGDEDALARFEDAYARARDQVRSMENHNYLMEQGVNGSLREAIRLMGEGLCRAGSLNAPDDILHLAMSEVQEAVDCPARDLRPLVDVRKMEFEERSRMSPPRTLGRGRAPSAAPESPGAESAPLGPGLDGRLLRGTAASRGEYAGRARVVRKGGPAPDVMRGDILVARNLGPDWTPVMPLLGAIVLDEGAVFQHAALIAREYRVPAVIQTKQATRVIYEGQVVAVDGSTGVVDLDPRLA